jgi:hypothetical protein
LDVLTVLLIVVAALASIPFGIGFAALVGLALFGPSPGEAPMAWLLGGALLVGLGLAALGIGLYRQQPSSASEELTRE